MKSTFRIICVAAISCSASVAQTSEQYNDCIGNASTQAAMHICASDEARRLDAQMKEVYQELLAAVKDQLVAIEKIKAAESAWIVYRDAYIEATYPAKDKLQAYGSIFSMEVNLLRSSLTRQHIRALNDLLKQHRGK